MIRELAQAAIEGAKSAVKKEAKRGARMAGKALVQKGKSMVFGEDEEASLRITKDAEMRKVAFFIDRKVELQDVQEYVVGSTPADGSAGASFSDGAFTLTGGGRDDKNVSLYPNFTSDETTFEYEGHQFKVYPLSEKSDTDNFGMVLSTEEGEKVLRGLVQVIYDYWKKQNSEDTSYYINDGKWSKVEQRTPYTFEQVVLEDGVAEDIKKDVRRFLTSRDFYEKNRVPYRRGYLLHGPPGTGKTSIAKAIAGEFGMDLYDAQLGSQAIDDSGLFSLFRATSPGSVILLEDIDAISTDRESESSNDLGAHITLSGLLNCLDGVVSQEGRIVVMTTNYPDDLDEALLRRGRADAKYEIGYPEPDQIRRFFLKFFPEEEGFASDAASSLSESDVKLSDLQDVMLNNTENPEAARDDAIDQFGN